MENFGKFFSSTAGKTTLILLISFSFLFIVFYFRKDEKIFSTKALTYSAILLALGISANQIKIFSLPQGGSMTLFSMIFIVFIGYMFGLRVGLIAGISFGLLNLLIKPEVYTPVQAIIDYILAFGALGLSGFFANKKDKLIFAYLVSIIGRFVFAVFSGYVFFGSYAPEGWNPLLYSIWYNLSYIGTEGVITVLLLSIPVVRNTLENLKSSNFKIN
ncbi:energy-coupled thiamine transporter ThiT [uncultured Parvimonas sp.]|uniref:energy-coupled thiamine transporter ThiT n=1 Tax=uncultured Parvimonas sp. TaxID=747372 RepID=UPI0028D2A538|nr:energy-coupled thiamine transporter ThiT [uncultured Parvimonas sp.]